MCRVHWRGLTEVVRYIVGKGLLGSFSLWQIIAPSLHREGMMAFLVRGEYGNYGSGALLEFYSGILSGSDRVLPMLIRVAKASEA